MKLINLCNKNLRCLSKPHYSLSKTLFSHRPNTIQSTKFSFHQSNSSIGSFLPSSEPNRLRFPPFLHSEDHSFTGFFNCSFNWVPSFASRSQIQGLSLIHGSFCCYSVSTKYRRAINGDVSTKIVSEIVHLIKVDSENLGFKLRSLNIRLSVASVIEILSILNSENVSALRFFEWIRNSQPECETSDTCSLVIDNCGHLDDYDSMKCLLNDFRLNQVCLTRKAFGFLPAKINVEGLMTKSVEQIVDVLYDVGGSCYTSGVRSLIEMFSGLGYFTVAEIVIRLTASRKLSHYNILIKDLCRRCYFEKATDLLNQIRIDGFEPNSYSYNLLISGLCSNGKFADAGEVFRDMKANGCLPDAITYEIFVCSYCRLGKFDSASKFVDVMVAVGVEPRHSTHAAFIKGLFNSRRYDEAYEYVVDSCRKYGTSSNMNYNLLVSLYQKKGDLVMARNILLEMFEKGLSPNFRNYAKVLRQLQNSGKEDLAVGLQTLFIEHRTETLRTEL